MSVVREAKRAKNATGLSYLHEVARKIISSFGKRITKKIIETRSSLTNELFKVDRNALKNESRMD